MSKTKRVGEKALRKEIVETALAMSRSGLSPGRSGNVSCRLGEGMLITPSGKCYEELSADDIVFVGRDGNAEHSEYAPSSEWHFHLAAYNTRPDRNALVHTHSLHATALACARKGIPAFHYMVAVAGGKDIPCVPYATFGTPELARHVADGLKDRDACLMANHGQIAIGLTLAAALELASEVEVLAEQFIATLSLGPAHILPDEEMDIVIEKFRHYGAKAGKATH